MSHCGCAGPYTHKFYMYVRAVYAIPQVPGVILCGSLVFHGLGYERPRVLNSSDRFSDKTDAGPFQ
jgi:hypothetical protein